MRYNLPLLTNYISDIKINFIFNINRSIHNLTWRFIQWRILGSRQASILRKNHSCKWGYLWRTITLS